MSRNPYPNLTGCVLNFMIVYAAFALGYIFGTLP